MNLKIFEKYRPFSHKPGTSYVLPGTSLVFTIYPTLIRWHDLSKKSPPTNLKLRVTGPVKGFTSQLDLDRGYITVWGHAKEGYYKYRIQPDDGDFSISTLKALTIDGEYKESAVPTCPPKLERLHLGVSKKQEWEMVERRCDPKELIPMWYALSQQVPDGYCDEAPSLLQQCKILIEHKDIKSICDAMLSLFHSAFNGVFIPRFHDEDHHGFTLPPFVSASPLGLLSASRYLIRNLFIQLEKNRVHILPSLPVDFHCGRFIEVKAGDHGELDIEWTKKSLRKLIFRCQKDTKLQFTFQNRLKTHRLINIREKSSKIVNCGCTFEFQSGVTYIFDKFKK